ncbi:hypothetical protein Tco_0259611 [Tanacetum coccineum]
MKAVKEKEQLQKTLDSWKDSSKNLWRLINSGMSSNSKVGLGYEIQLNNEVLSYEEEMNFSVFNCSEEDSVGKPLYRRIGMHMGKELGEGYSFTKVRKYFVVAVLSHLIKDCDYYEKKMARDVEAKKQRMCNTGIMMEKPVWTNANRVNHANQFVPKPVQLNGGRPNANSVRPNVNTGRVNVNSVRCNVNTGRTNVNPVRPTVNTGSSNVNTVRSRQPVPTKTSNSFSPKRPQDHPLKNMVDRGIFDSGCSGHMTGMDISKIIRKQSKTGHARNTGKRKKHKIARVIKPIQE